MFSAVHHSFLYSWLFQCSHSLLHYLPGLCRHLSLQPLQQKLLKTYPPQHLYVLYLFSTSLHNWVVSSIRQRLCTPHLSKYHQCLPHCLVLKYLLSEWININKLVVLKEILIDKLKSLYWSSMNKKQLITNSSFSLDLTI